MTADCSLLGYWTLSTRPAHAKCCTSGRSCSQGRCFIHPGGCCPSWQQGQHFSLSQSAELPSPRQDLMRTFSSLGGSCCSGLRLLDAAFSPRSSADGTLSGATHLGKWSCLKATKKAQPAFCMYWELQVADRMCLQLGSALWQSTLFLVVSQYAKLPQVESKLAGVVVGPQSSNKIVELCALPRWLYFLKAGMKNKVCSLLVVSRCLEY